jgi:ERCC4-related helicase
VPKAFIFSSSEGHTLCWLILAALLPYEPDDFQIEGICKMLDGINLFAILATGMGKTRFLSMYMLVVLAIEKEPSLCPTAKFTDNPCMLVICPTKYLEHQMVRFRYDLTEVQCTNIVKIGIMDGLGLKGLVINGDTIHAVRYHGM